MSDEFRVIRLDELRRQARELDLQLCAQAQREHQEFMRMMRPRFYWLALLAALAIACHYAEQPLYEYLTSKEKGANGTQSR